MVPYNGPVGRPRRKRFLLCGIPGGSGVSAARAPHARELPAHIWVHTLEYLRDGRQVAWSACRAPKVGISTDSFSYALPTSYISVAVCTPRSVGWNEDPRRRRDRRGPLTSQRRGQAGVGGV